jgi:adenylate cyclase
MAPSEVNRKLTAILSADVVGFSRLMADDEAATVETIKQYRASVGRVIDRHKGRIVNAPGDNILAEFVSAVEAVQAAVEIQKAIEGRNVELPENRRMQFRVGVNLGDVIQEEDGTIYGDGVNIAARMEALADTGGICISSTVYDAVEGKLDFGFDFLGEQPVKNIAKPVRVYRVRGESEALVKARAKPGKQPGRLRTALVATAAVLLLLGLGVWATWPQLLGLGVEMAGVVPSDSPALPDLPSIVVLPFANMSGDPEQEYFSDGITEDLTNALAGSPSLFVISRNSAFTYKDKAAKVEDIGRALGVRYVLEGSVRKAGDRVRITAQLIDATTGFHQWSRQYDRALDDIFAVQSEISEQILGAVGAEINAAELARIRAKPTDDLSAHDAFTRGAALFTRYTRTDLLEARQLVEHAVELDPDFADAHAMIGATYSAEYGLGYSFDDSLLERALAKAAEAIRLDPQNAFGYTLQASVHMQFPDRADRAIAAAEKAIELAPSFPAPHSFRGSALARKGQLAEGLDSMRKAFRLDPRIASNPAASTSVAAIYAATGQMDKAVELWVMARAASPDMLSARLSLIEYYMSKGDEESAGEVAAEVRSRHPHVTAELAGEFAARFGARSADDMAMLLANLKRAGLP